MLCSLELNFGQTLIIKVPSSYHGLLVRMHPLSGAERTKFLTGFAETSLPSTSHEGMGTPLCLVKFRGQRAASPLQAPLRHTAITAIHANFRRGELIKQNIVFV